VQHRVSGPGRRRRRVLARTSGLIRHLRTAFAPRGDERTGALPSWERLQVFFRVLERWRDAIGLPCAIVVDTGPELAGATLDAWAYVQHIELRFIRRGKPIANA